MKKSGSEREGVGMHIDTFERRRRRRLKRAPHRLVLLTERFKGTSRHEGFSRKTRTDNAGNTRGCKAELLGLEREMDVFEWMKALR